MDQENGKISAEAKIFKNLKRVNQGSERSALVLTIRKVKVKNIYFNVYTQIKRDMEVVIVIRFDLVKVFTSGGKTHWIPPAPL